MKKWVWVAVIVASLVTGYAVAYALKPAVPNITGYLEGQEILFQHTEVSDPKVAELLSEMVSSPVLVVPALAQAPPSLLANVFVFKNGVRGGGPFKYQPDVFDNPPGSEGYRPLRALALVTWKNEQAARVLKSEREVKAAEQAGEVVIERPGVVVNMPLVTWPGGRR
ncbi:MAG: hypothetical protein A2X51_02635 [Candidatus Rokubacteria bacterium GWC2_70_24]|nr:MAG: hypothetical protein A2X53_02630 [Candidatus Rokubacteria bacterium GWA2_70_23]OGK93867.1 MAG: hypothetical protein A2X51_02635 [Candidatus Rokubacteria bacterium GWC2_70_24]